MILSSSIDFTTGWTRLLQNPAARIFWKGESSIKSPPTVTSFFCRMKPRHNWLIHAHFSDRIYFWRNAMNQYLDRIAIASDPTQEEQMCVRARSLSRREHASVPNLSPPVSVRVESMDRPQHFFLYQHLHLVFKYASHPTYVDAQTIPRRCVEIRMSRGKNSFRYFFSKCAGVSRRRHYMEPKETPDIRASRFYFNAFISERTRNAI